jgi:hypothetical protein
MASYCKAHSSTILDFTATLCDSTSAPFEPLASWTATRQDLQEPIMSGV